MKMLTLAFPLILLLSGCSDSHAPKEAFVYVIDYSGSTESMRRGQVSTVVAELETAPLDSLVTVLRMGSSTEEIYSGKLDDTGVDSITETMIHDTAHSDPKKGTNFAKMAEALKATCDRYASYSLAIRVLTDGADDFKWDPTSRKAYLSAAKTVATRSNLRGISFIGVQPPYREDVRNAFSVAGEKLTIPTPGAGE